MSSHHNHTAHDLLSQAADRIAEQIAAGDDGRFDPLLANIYAYLKAPVSDIEPPAVVQNRALEHAALIAEDHPDIARRIRALKIGSVPAAPCVVKPPQCDYPRCLCFNGLQNCPYPVPAVGATAMGNSMDPAGAGTKLLPDKGSLHKEIERQIGALSHTMRTDEYSMVLPLLNRCSQIIKGFEERFAVPPVAATGETPRTDALEVELKKLGYHAANNAFMDHARQLERELAEAKDDLRIAAATISSQSKRIGVAEERIAELEATPSSTNAPQSFRWLVEKQENVAFYWTGEVHEGGFWSWTADSHKAVHFPTKEAAETAINRLRLYSAWPDQKMDDYREAKAVEHGFIHVAPPSATGTLVPNDLLRRARNMCLRCISPELKEATAIVAELDALSIVPERKSP